MDTFLKAHKPQAQTGVWVTLTFAQSQDGKIAGRGKQPLRLSGAESMIMTHKLRAMHEAIMVGIGTVKTDNPRLTVRLDGYDGPSPRPVILDARLETPLTCNLFSRGRPSHPLILTAEPTEETAAWEERRRALEAAGAQVRVVKTQGTRLAWSSVLDALARENLRSLMVEGGATVIDGLLATPAVLSKVIVTIAPCTVGSDGYGYTSQSLQKEGTFRRVGTLMLSPDTVVAWDPCM